MTRRCVAIVAGILVAVLVTGPLTVAASDVPPEGDVEIRSGTGFSAEQRAEIRRLVRTADAELPIVVRILRELPAEASGSADAWADTVRRREAAGLALVWAGDDAVPPYGGSSNGSRPIETLRDELAARGGDAREQFVRLVEVATRPERADQLMAGRDERLLEEEQRRLDERKRTRTTERGASERRVARWLAIGGIALLALLAFLLLLRSRLRGHRKASRLGRVVTEAEAAILADRAKADLLALGAAIDAERMDAHDDLGEWQKALDDYAEAGRVHDRRSGVEDDRRVVELCGRGHAHLAAAQRDP